MSGAGQRPRPCRGHYGQSERNEGAVVQRHVSTMIAGKVVKSIATTLRPQSVIPTWLRKRCRSSGSLPEKFGFRWKSPGVRTRQCPPVGGMLPVQIASPAVVLQRAAPALFGLAFPIASV
jgi:hypothetical protein